MADPQLVDDVSRALTVFAARLQLRCTIKSSLDEILVTFINQRGETYVDCFEQKTTLHGITNAVQLAHLLASTAAHNLLPPTVDFKSLLAVAPSHVPARSFHAELSEALAVYASELCLNWMLRPMQAVDDSYQVIFEDAARKQAHQQLVHSLGWDSATELARSLAVEAGRRLLPGHLDVQLVLRRADLKLLARSQPPEPPPPPDALQATPQQAQTRHELSKQLAQAFDRIGVQTAIQAPAQPHPDIVDLKIQDAAKSQLAAALADTYKTIDTVKFMLDPSSPPICGTCAHFRVGASSRGGNLCAETGLEFYGVGAALNAACPRYQRFTAAAVSGLPRQWGDPRPELTPDHPQCRSNASPAISSKDVFPWEQDKVKLTIDGQEREAEWKTTSFSPEPPTLIDDGRRYAEHFQRSQPVKPALQLITDDGITALETLKQLAGVRLAPKAKKGE